MKIVGLGIAWCMYSLVVSLSYEQQLVTDLARYARLTDQEKSQLWEMASDKDTSVKSLEQKVELPLFKAYPALQKNIPYVHLGSLPTRIHHCKNLGSQFNKTQVYIKCDNETGGVFNNQALFGGNKVRKLEFLLADAVAHGARSVMTFGCAGSNHALATAAYAEQLGLEAELVLLNQPNSHVVRRNLLLDLYHKAHITLTPTRAERSAFVTKFYAQHKGQFCSFPYIIPVGGSCARGILGFVNAAFELKEQIKSGMLPEPEYIIVPCGSCGTVAGLMLGCKMAGLKSVIIPVAVEPDDHVGEMEAAIASKFNDTVELLAEYEPSCAHYSLNAADVQVVHEFQGTEYALFTEEAAALIKIMKDSENVTLDGVYSGKAACALYSWLNQSKNDTPILFWNTFCGDSFEELTSTVDYTQLPVEFHKYFTEDVQPLDR